MNYHDLAMPNDRQGIRQHQASLIKWTELVGRLSHKLSMAFNSFSNDLDDISKEMRQEVEMATQQIRNE